MSPSSFRAALVAILLAAGCGTETGVLIEVTRDESVPADVDRLEFYVGIDKIESHPSNFVDFDEEDGVRVGGRDLAEDPYRLMLRTGDYPDNGIMVAVLALRNQEVVGFGALDGPVPFVDGKVTMWSVVLSAELPGGFVITEEGCLRFVDDEGNYVSIGRPGDLDCDGYIDGEGDCNDLDPGVNSGANETCENGVDEDCDQAVDENVDDDGDQVTTCDGDCDDSDETVNPAADDRCDGVDNNCNGVCDDSHDADHDQFTVCGSRQFQDGTCIIDEGQIDCDDGNDQSYPGAAEICDGGDNDCDGTCDDDSFLDRDGDRYTECGSVVGACGKFPELVDCSPEDGAIHPGALELCNGQDDDCDGQYLTAGPCFGRDGDGGACSLSVRTCNETAGSGEWGDSCTYLPDEASQVPAALCDAFDGCVADPDPFGCAATGGGNAACDVNFQVSSKAQCPGRVVALPTDGLTGCTWSIVGGTTSIGEYVIGLVPVDAPDGVAAATLDVCDAALRVTMTDATPPSGPVIVLVHRSEEVAGEDYYVFDLANVPNDGCAPPAGLVCSGP